MRHSFFIAALLLTGISASPLFAATATAEMKGTEWGSKIGGQVKFEETNGRLKITADIKNAPPGKHGFHIHENGSCEDKGNAAGGHFNPDFIKHGLLTQDGFSGAHAGDLGNIEIASDGTGHMETDVPGLNLTEGKYNISNRAVILHEKLDDFGQPTGNAGARIACGVINGGVKPAAEAAAQGAGKGAQTSAAKQPSWIDQIIAYFQSLTAPKKS